MLNLKAQHSQIKQVKMNQIDHFETSNQGQIKSLCRIIT